MQNFESPSQLNDIAETSLAHLRSVLSSNDTLISSYIAGMSGVLLGFPLDSLKTRMQTHKFDSLRVCITDTFRNEGSRGFYRGIVPPLLTNSCIKSAAFTIYEASRNNLFERFLDGRQPLQQVFVSGALSGAAISLLSSPLDLVKVQMQLQKLNLRQLSTATSEYSTRYGHKRFWMMAPLVRSGEYSFRHSWDCFRKIMRNKRGGIATLYHGYPAQLTRESLGFGVYFTAYEAICRALNRHVSKRDEGWLTHFVSGGLSGLVIWLVIFPFDLVKCRLQREALHETRLYSGMLDCFVKTFRDGGISQFYSGIKPSLLRAFPVHATVFTIYEASRSTLSKLD